MKLTAKRPTAALVPLVSLAAALLVGSLLAAVPATAQVEADPVPRDCAYPIDPVPTGPLGRTNEPFPKLDYDHRYIHSGTHLQGVRTYEKWAGGLIHHPPASTGFGDMTGAVIVDNPDPSQWMTVQIQFYDSLGVPAGGPIIRTIEPEGFRAVAATPLGNTAYGMGTARVTVTDGPPLVGATLQHANELLGVVDQDLPLSTHGVPPGAGSKQQLQVVQEDATRLWWGPMPVSLTSAVDFFNGNLPWFHVVNPNNAPNTIQVNLSYFDRNAGVVVGPILWRTVTLPPYGTLTEITGPHLTALGTMGVGLFNQVIQLYATPGIDWDLWVDVSSDDGLPILGDGYLLDLLGPSGAGSRFRMASTMMASKTKSLLRSPELSFQLPGGIIRTLVGITNVGSAAAGPIVIQYYDNNGNLLATSNLASLPAGQSLRIQPGTFNYPTGTSGFGSLRVIACLPYDDLVGWTVREILHANIGQQYHKAYGEALLHLNGDEPGPGWVEPSTGLTRKVMPLMRVASPPWEWPGYTTFGNFSVSNIGSYNWEFHDRTGILCALTNFPGLPFGYTSWTYEDLLNFCTGTLNMSGRVDHDTGRIEGIKVLGDPFDEYGIAGFAPWGGLGGYVPGDVVGFPPEGW